MKNETQKNPTDGHGSTDTIWDLIVIGGGPAGMIAAGRAAEKARQNGSTGSKVLLLEKNHGIGAKLLITGGGRCNVTNAEFDERALLAKFKDSSKFLFSAFAQHGVSESLEFFNGRGMATKVEPEKRVFPVSDSARSVWDVLVAYMKAGNVTVRSNCGVIGLVQSEPGRIDGVRVVVGHSAVSADKDGTEVIRAKDFVLATGGKSHPETGSTGEGFEWLAKIGHTVRQPSAALVPIEVRDQWVKDLSGVSLPAAKITLFHNDVKQSVTTGKVLFTHFGLSGPAILNMSAEVAELLEYAEPAEGARGGPHGVVMSLDLLPQHDHATLNEALQKLFAAESNKKFKNALGTSGAGGGAGRNSGLIPQAFVPVVLEQSGINPDVACNSVTREQRLGLIAVLKGLDIHPTRLLGTDKAIITSGGVALEEVDFKTMRSRLVPNLFLIGDVLDIDRPSGGYSLQLCWTTGWVAGNNA